MKKMFMMMLLSIVSWTGAVTAAEATAPLKSNGPVAQQEAVVAADTLNGMTPSEAFQIRMKELAVERENALSRRAGCRGYNRFFGSSFCYCFTFSYRFFNCLFLYLLS